MNTAFRRRSRGAAIGLVLALVSVLIAIGVGMYAFISQVSGQRELQNAVDAGTLNVARMLLTLRVRKNDSTGTFPEAPEEINLNEYNYCAGKLYNLGVRAGGEKGSTKEPDPGLDNPDVAQNLRAVCNVVCNDQPGADTMASRLRTEFERARTDGRFAGWFDAYAKQNPLLALFGKKRPDLKFVASKCQLGWVKDDNLLASSAKAETDGSLSKNYVDINGAKYLKGYQRIDFFVGRDDGAFTVITVPDGPTSTAATINKDYFSAKAPTGIPESQGGTPHPQIPPNAVLIQATVDYGGGPVDVTSVALLGGDISNITQTTPGEDGFIRIKNGDPAPSLSLIDSCVDNPLNNELMVGVWITDNGCFSLSKDLLDRWVKYNATEPKPPSMPPEFAVDGKVVEAAQAEKLSPDLVNKLKGVHFIYSARASGAKASLEELKAIKQVQQQTTNKNRETVTCSHCKYSNIDPERKAAFRKICSDYLFSFFNAYGRGEQKREALLRKPSAVEFVKGEVINGYRFAWAGQGNSRDPDEDAPHQMVIDHSQQPLQSGMKKWSKGLKKTYIWDPDGLWLGQYYDEYAGKGKNVVLCQTGGKLFVEGDNTGNDSEGSRPTQIGDYLRMLNAVGADDAAPDTGKLNELVAQLLPTAQKMDKAITQEALRDLLLNAEPQLNMGHSVYLYKGVTPGSSLRITTIKPSKFQGDAERVKPDGTEVVTVQSPSYKLSDSVLNEEPKAKTMDRDREDWIKKYLKNHKKQTRDDAIKKLPADLDYSAEVPRSITTGVLNPDHELGIHRFLFGSVSRVNPDSAEPPSLRARDSAVWHPSSGANGFLGELLFRNEVSGANRFSGPN